MGRSSHTILGGCVLAFAAAVGCHRGPSASNDAALAPTTDTSPTETTAGQLAADLPCDVAAIIRGTCASCHGPVLAHDAKIHLTSRADLTRTSASDPSKTVAALCVARMQQADKPMPPNASALDSAVQVFSDWIAAGMPEGTCSPAGVDYDTDTVCTSNQKWTLRDRGSKEMRPGVACISCHEQSGGRDAEIYSVAGTLYPSAHEPDDCYGADGTSTTAAKPQVIITDAAGKSFTLAVNAAGNFYTAAAMTFPVHAKVKKGDVVYEMGGAIKDGDCNACHTQDGRANEGNDYPRGRIVVP